MDQAPFGPVGFLALTVTVVLGVGLGAVISAAAAHGYAKGSVSGKLSWDPTGVSLDGVAVASLAIAVLGVLCISSEYSSGMIRTSLSPSRSEAGYWQPRRWSSPR